MSNFSYRTFCRFLGGKDDMSYTVAGIDVHKNVLMVVVALAGDEVADPAGEAIEFKCRRFGAGSCERKQIVDWLQQHNVREVVMESTAQYWKPVWLDLEPHFPKLHLAQAHSNRAPKGRKNDFGDAKRLTRRLLADELMLSFVPDAEQRRWRTMTRGKQQLVRDRVRLQNQLEALLEEARIKLSSVISDLLGVSGRRILKALSEGETNPDRLAELGDDRLKCTPLELSDALTGSVEPVHRELLKLYLERLHLLDQQIEKLDQMTARALKQHEEAVVRVAEIPGFGPDSAQQLIAEMGVDAAAFPSAGQFSSWAGLCPGSNVSAEQNQSSRSAKGNHSVRRILTQAAQAAVKKQGGHFRSLFSKTFAATCFAYRQPSGLCPPPEPPRLEDSARQCTLYREQGQETNAKAKKRRAQKMIRGAP